MNGSTACDRCTDAISYQEAWYQNWKSLDLHGEWMVSQQNGTTICMQLDIIG